MALLTLEPISIDTSLVVQQLSAGVIQGLPQVNQLNEPTADHASDENARMNCVFAGNAAVARKVGNHPEANGDAIKDACSNYGQNYTGGADEEVVESDGCLDVKWGIHADTFHAGSRDALLAECKHQADAGNFTMVTIPSMWGSQPSQPGYNPDSPDFWTHAVIYCGYEGDTHYLMNPWGGFIMTYSSAELALRLCYLKVYPIRAAAVQPQVNPMIVLETNATGTITGAHDKDHPELHLGAGIAQAASDNKLLGGSITVPETPLASGEVIAVVRGGARAAFTYSKAHGTKVWGDDVVLAFNDLYDALQKAKAQPAPADNTKAIADLKAAAAALTGAITEVK